MPWSFIEICQGTQPKFPSSETLLQLKTEYKTHKTFSSGVQYRHVNKREGKKQK